MERMPFLIQLANPDPLTWPHTWPQEDWNAAHLQHLAAYHCHVPSGVSFSHAGFVVAIVHSTSPQVIPFKDGQAACKWTWLEEEEVMQLWAIEKIRLPAEDHRAGSSLVAPPLRLHHLPSELLACARQTFQKLSQCGRAKLEMKAKIGAIQATALLTMRVEPKSLHRRVDFIPALDLLQTTSLEDLFLPLRLDSAAFLTEASYYCYCSA